MSHPIAEAQSALTALNLTLRAFPTSESCLLQSTASEEGLCDPSGVNSYQRLVSVSLENPQLFI